VKTPYRRPYVQLVEQLVAARKERGITQQQLAEQLGELQTYVSKVEQRHRRLDVLEFCEWAQALAVDPVPLLEAVSAAVAGERDRGGKRYVRKKVKA
jgi:transcriptional regulator with XRE-family HTH domain